MSRSEAEGKRAKRAQREPVVRRRGFRCLGSEKCDHLLLNRPNQSMTPVPAPNARLRVQDRIPG